MEKPTPAGRRGKRLGILCTLAALLVLMASMGAAPAQGQEDGVGSASARGTDPDAVATIIAGFETEVVAQYSAITNCDEAQNTRPFIVRLPDPLDTTITRTSTDTSTCHSENGTSVNEGTGTATVSGLFSRISWRFEESPDNVVIEWTDGVSALSISGAPEPLNGTPGGVWVFGELPWPAPAIA